LTADRTHLTKPCDTQAQALPTDLFALGFAAIDLVHYTSDEMKSQDLKLIKAHHALTQSQCSFLVVHAHDNRTPWQYAAKYAPHFLKA
jgi:hypothetical protein